MPVASGKSYKTNVPVSFGKKKKVKSKKGKGIPPKSLKKGKGKKK